VKCLAWKVDRPLRFRLRDVHPLADERVAVQPRLDPNLVPLARLELHVDKRTLPELLDDAVVAHRLHALRISRTCLLLPQRLPVPDEVIAPRAVLRPRMSVDDREIHALRVAADELLLHRLLRPRILCEHDEPGRVAIDPVDDERPAALRAQVALEPAVHGRRVRLSRKRHRKQTGALVDDNQHPVFVDDVEIDFQGVSSARAIARSGDILSPSAEAASKAAGDSSVSSFAV